MTGTTPPVSGTERLGDYSTDRRVLLLSAGAAVLGILGALVAAALLWLINVITNIAYFARLSSAPVTPADNVLGAASILIPVAGGLIISAMAR
jgi:hypothetical protein